MDDEPEMQAPLPSYDRPPVVEVAIGVQFEALDKFSAPYIGLFWEQIKDRYPKTQVTAPIQSMIEAPESERIAAESTNQAIVTDVPPMPRTFFIDEVGNWILQVQEDRVLHNWRKVKDDDEYPRYPAALSMFNDAWKVFNDFCNEEDLGVPTINQLEMTYVNRIPQGAGWASLADIGEVFPDLTWRAGQRFLPPPSAAAWRTVFPLPEQQGRLHVTLRHGIEPASRSQLLLCDLTARGMPTTADPDAIDKWFTLAREWIVRGFTDLSADRIQRTEWGRTT